MIVKYDWIKNVIFEQSHRKPQFSTQCSAEEIANSTHYFSSNNMCWEIELFEGGKVSVDRSNPYCLNQKFEASGLLGEFDYVTDDGKYVFKRCSNGIHHECKDDSKFTFPIQSNMFVGCEWIDNPDISDVQRSKRFSKWCNHSTSFVRNLCPRACGDCLNECKDDASYRWRIYDGSLKGCDYILKGARQFQDEKRYNRWCDMSKADNKRKFCPRSCGLCPINEEKKTTASKCNHSHLEWSGEVSLTQNEDETLQRSHFLTWDPFEQKHNIEMNYRKCNFNTCERNEIEFKVELILDKWPSETSWTLENVCSTTKKLTTKGNAEGAKLCIKPGKYKFTMKDSFGDGMCCKQGQGEYKVYFDGSLVSQGGDFKHKEESYFGVKCHTGVDIS